MKPNRAVRIVRLVQRKFKYASSRMRLKRSMAGSSFIAPCPAIVEVKELALMNREWDRGKDSWNEGTSWNGADGRTNVRPREEDYYAEGKRRKYNSGGYDASQTYDEGSHDGGYSQNRQIDSIQDYTQEERPQRGGFVKKRLLSQSVPSPHVIFLGLDPDFTEADLQAYLTANGCNIETVTIIRERSSGTCPFVFASAHTLTLATVGF